MADYIPRKKKIPSLEALDIGTLDIRIVRRKKMPGLERLDTNLSDIPVIRKKGIPNLEALDIGTSNIPTRRKPYYYRPSRNRKSFVLSGEVKIVLPKPGYQISRKNEPVRTMQARPKPKPKPKPKPLPKVKKTPPSKLAKPGREDRTYQPNPEEIQRVAHVMRELERRRVKEMMDTDTRDEEF